MATSLLKSAVQSYLDRGFLPLPVYGLYPDLSCRCGSADCDRKNAGKHLKEEHTKQWQDNVPFSPEQFQEFDNVSLDQGKQPSGRWLVTLDIDGELDIDSIFGFKLPDTMSEKTPRGRHLIYEVPPKTALGNWRDCLFTKQENASRGILGQLDLRYERGRTVVSPSRNAMGPYVKENDLEPEMLPRDCVVLIHAMRKKHGLPVQKFYKHPWER